MTPTKVIKKIVTIITKVNNNTAIEKRIAIKEKINEKIVKSIELPNIASVTPAITNKTIAIISLPHK